MQTNDNRSNSLEALAIAASIVDAITSSQNEELMVKPKRKRASEYQLAVLRQHYAKDPFPSTHCRQQLALKLGMTPRSVQIWFQNQRQHFKMKSMDSKNLEPSSDLD
jgi:hypothetical protein